MERKTSLAARLQFLGSAATQSSSQGDDQPTSNAQKAACADTNPVLAPAQQPKRRLPGWLTAPPPETQPAAAELPLPPQPKISIRARVAAQAPSALAGAAAAGTAPVPAAAGTLAAGQAGATAAATAAAAAAAAAATASNTAGSRGAGHQASRGPLPDAGPKTSLASLLSKPRTYTPMISAPAAAAPVDETAAGPTGGVGAPQQQAAEQLQVVQQPRPSPARRRLPASLAAAAVGTAAADGSGGGDGDSPPGKSSQQQQQQQGSQDSLWDSDEELQQEGKQRRQQDAASRAAHRQQQQQEQELPQQEERELTLQQRQARQMAQLGVKLPGAAGAAAVEDAWLAGVFSGAAGGRSSGGSSRRQQGRRGSGGGPGGGGGAAAAAGSGGSSRRQQGSNAAGGSGGQARGGGRPAAGSGLPETGREDPAVATAAAAGVAAAGVEGSTHPPLVLFDAESNLQLQVPGSINQHLRSYQRQGVEFLFRRYAAGSGGVLCDDMGLGKTVQAISFIAALLGKQGTPQDTLPRSFAAFRRQRQQARAQRRQLHTAGCGKAGSGGPAAAAAAAGGAASSDESDEGEEEEEDEDVEDAGSTIRWPVLVVCPTSVLDNWMRELNMWGTFKAIKYHGPPAARAAIADEASGGQYEVILTSYDTLRVDAPAINALHPHAVIFDEAHKLKNSKSKQYEAAQALDTKYRYGLSGTVMQNDWDELYAVLDLLCPYCLGEYGGYVEYYSKPIKRGQSSTASNYEKVKSEKRLKQLVDVVKQVTLRRTKAIIADQLPRKTDNVVFCQLQPLQYRAYDRTLASPDLQALRMAKSPCDCGSGLKAAECCHEMVPAEEGGVMWPHYHCCDCRVEGCKRHRPYGCREYYESLGYTNVRLVCPYCLMLPALGLLTKISNHLDMIRPDAKLEQQDERQFQYELAVARMVLGNDADVLGGLMANSSGWLGASDETHCGKMATLKMLLQTWACDYSSHNKVLLFSHSTRCLDLLEAFVQRQGWDYVRLDGSTPQKLRQGICDEFNNRPSIFLLLMSTVAGGLGLNLTAANKVVVFDPSWNPAHDLQAQDRAYRLGQTRDVAVYRLVGTGTLEEAVYKRQIYKQQQANMVIDGAQEPRYFEGVQGDKEKTGELWGLWNLLRFSGQTVETRDILQAYKGRHRQQVEQQLQDDARRQQQEQQQDGQAGQAGHAVVPSGAGAGGAAAAAAAGAAAGAAAAKPFKIVVLDQLVGSANEDGDPGFEGLLLEDGEGAAGGSSRRRGKQGSRKRHSSDDGAAAAAAAGDAGEGAAAGTGVGGIAVDDEAWCDESLLDVLLDDLLPGDGTSPGRLKQQQQQQQQQQGPKQRRRRAVLTDSDGEGEEEGAAAAGQAAGRPGLSPVAEGWAEGEEGVESEGAMQDSMGVEEEEQLSDDSAGGPAHSADGIGQPVAAFDPVLAALEEQGAIMHVHRHEKVLGLTKKSKAAQQHTQEAPSSRQRRTSSSSKQAPASQQQQTQRQQQRHERKPAGGQPLRSIVRCSVADAYQQCSQADADAAAAAAQQGWGPVASLAVWQGVSVAEMALWLLQQTPEQRQQLLAMYADDVQQSG